MTPLAQLQAMGVTVKAIDGELKLEGLKKLTKAKVAEGTRLARDHKSEIFRTVQAQSNAASQYPDERIVSTVQEVLRGAKLQSWEPWSGSSIWRPEEKQFVLDHLQAERAKAKRPAINWPTEILSSAKDPAIGFEKFMERLLAWARPRFAKQGERAVGSVRQWDEETVRLIEWLKRFSLPQKFVLRQNGNFLAVSVNDGGQFKNDLLREAALGPGCPRNKYGAVQKDLRRLWELFGVPGN
jgi:hypothetical protein